MAKRKNEEQLKRLYEQFAESVLSMSDSDLLSAYSDSAEKEVAAVRRVIQESTSAVRKSKLVEAQAAYERQIAAMKTKQYAIPEDPQKRRDMLISVLARRPDMRTALTAQFRDFKEMSDSDIRSALKQLLDLGILEE